MYSLKNKILLFIILLTCIITFVGCKKNDYPNDLKISVGDIYSQNENNYYVFFYKDSCPYCEDVFPTINNYINSEDKKVKLYVCDLSDKEKFVYNIYIDNYISEIEIIDNEVISCSNAINITKENNIFIIDYPNNISITISFKRNKVNINGKSIIKYELIKKEEVYSIIKRAYTGADGQGSSGKYFVDGVNKYTDLYIAGVPSLIEINEKNISKFVVSGKSGIKNYFESIN